MDGNVYTKRLNEFRRAKADAKSTLLRNYYNRAINLTEGSLWILSDLIECGNAKFKEDKKHIDNRFTLQRQKLKRIEDQIKEAQQELETKTDNLSRSIAILNLKMLRSSLDIDIFGNHTELLSIQSSVRLELPFTHKFSPHSHFLQV